LLTSLSNRAFSYDTNFRSVSTGALYPKDRPSYFDIFGVDPPDDADDDAGGEDDGLDDAELEKIAKKAAEVGQHSLAASLIQHLQNRLDRRREQHGYITKKQEEPKMDRQQESAPARGQPTGGEPTDQPRPGRAARRSVERPRSRHSRRRCGSRNEPCYTGPQ
jgi:hypothetical protein